MPNSHQKYLEAINAFASELINARSINDVVWAVVQKAISTLNYHDCVIYLYNPETCLLDQISAHGPKEAIDKSIINALSIKPGKGIVGSVYNSGIGEIIPDTSLDNRYIIDDAIRYSELTIPIIHQSEVLGIIDCEHPDKNFFTDNDFKIISAIATFTATKIIQARNDEKLLNHKKELEKAVNIKTSQLNNRIIDLQRANKELDQFAYIVAHDLKSPLKNIALLAEWIKEDIEEVTDMEPDVLENLALLNSRVKRLDKIINGVLDYSKIGKNKLELELCNPETLVTDLLASMFIPEYVQIKLNISESPMLLDKLNVNRIVQNLIENAIKYSDKKNPNIEIGIVRKKQDFEIYVTDDGPGISPMYHEKVFGIFQTLTTKDENESTGIGLSLVKKIVEENGAKISLKSDKGKGCHFSITWTSKEKQPD